MKKPRIVGDSGLETTPGTLSWPVRGLPCQPAASWPAPNSGGYHPVPSARVMSSARGEYYGEWSIRSQCTGRAITTVWQAAEVEISSHGLICRPHPPILEAEHRVFPVGGARLTRPGIPVPVEPGEDRARGGSHWHWPCTGGNVARLMAAPPSAVVRSPQMTRVGAAVVVAPHIDKGRGSPAPQRWVCAGGAQKHGRITSSR
jgi:hypothetical protein